MISKARRKLIYKRIANFLTPCGAMIPKSGSPQWERKNWWLKKAGLKIGKNVIIASHFYCLTELEENITVDDHAVIGSGIKIYNFNLVNIGSLTLIASDVTPVNVALINTLDRAAKERLNLIQVLDSEVKRLQAELKRLSGEI